MISAKGVRKSWADQVVLNKLDLQVDAGEVLGLVGPNGSGKTTFLKCLLGMVAPDEGAIRVAGSDARQQSLAVRQKTAYAPSETTLWPWMRAAEMLDFCLGFFPGADREMGLSLLREFQVPSDRRIAALSHGMKRKVLLAQAFACRCPVLLLDEPMEGLDPVSHGRVEELVQQTAAGGVAILFSSHDLSGVERMSDRISFLRDGAIVDPQVVEEVRLNMERKLRLFLREEVPLENLPEGSGLSWVGAAKEWTLSFDGQLESVLPLLSWLPIARIRPMGDSLAEVFDRLYSEDQST